MTPDQGALSNVSNLTLTLREVAPNEQYNLAAQSHVLVTFAAS